MEEAILVAELSPASDIYGQVYRLEEPESMTARQRVIVSVLHSHRSKTPFSIPDEIKDLLMHRAYQRVSQYNILYGKDSQLVAT